MRAVKRLRGAPGIVRLECGLGTPLYLDIRGKRVLRMLVVLQAPPLICVKINSDDPLQLQLTQRATLSCYSPLYRMGTGTRRIPVYIPGYSTEPQ